MSRLSAVGVAAGCGVAATAWIALLLAELGVFSPIPPIIALVVVTAGLVPALRRRPTPSPSEGARRFTDLAALAVAAATLLFSLPPSEIVLGGWDPGVYVHTAAAVAAKGSLRIEEPDLAALTGEEKDLFTRNWYYVEPYPGMRMLPDGRVSPQFYHLYPGLMAVLYGVGGIEAAWLLNPLLAAASVLALYALALQIIGPWWGFLASLTLAVNPGQIWQSKFTTAELLTQFLLLSGTALLAASLRRGGDPLRSGIAGFLLGCALLARYDSLVFLAVFLIFVVAGAAWSPRGRHARFLLAGFVPMALHAWIHQRFVAPFYEPLGGQTTLALAAAGTALIMLLALSRTRVGPRVLVWLKGNDPKIRWCAALLVICWAGFGWFVRPGLGNSPLAAAVMARLRGIPLAASAWHFLSGPESGDALYLVDLFGAAGYAAAVLGVAGMIITSRGWWQTSWLAGSCALFVLFTSSVFHDHFLMWVTRRFVPVVLPLLAVGAAASGALLARRLGRSGVAAGTALIALILALNLPSTAFLAGSREWSGLLSWYRGLERLLPEDATVFCDQPGFAAPLRFLSGRRSYEFPRKNPELWSARLAAMRRRAAGDPAVYFLAGQPIEGAGGLGLGAVAELPLRSTALTQPRRGVPREMRERGADFVLYRVRPE